MDVEVLRKYFELRVLGEEHTELRWRHSRGSAAEGSVVGSAPPDSLRLKQKIEKSKFLGEVNERLRVTIEGRTLPAEKVVWALWYGYWPADGRLVPKDGDRRNLNIGNWKFRPYKYTYLEQKTLEEKEEKEEVTKEEAEQMVRDRLGGIIQRHGVTAKEAWNIAYEEVSQECVILPETESTPRTERSKHTPFDLSGEEEYEQLKKSTTTGSASQE